MTFFNNRLYFNANDGVNGGELWRTDGTTAGTVIVTNIASGATWGEVNQITIFNNKMYFSGNDGVNGKELWMSDGTAAGTSMVKNIASGSTGSTPDYITVVNNRLYFNANDGVNGVELWSSDGTSVGTNMVKDISSGSTSSEPTYLTGFNNKVYFWAFEAATGVEVWSSDGTSAGTLILKDIRPGPNPARYTSDLTVFTVCNNRLYFSVTDGTNGMELWRTDGTTAGTVMVHDIASGASGSFPGTLNNFFAVLNDKLYFPASTGATGVELFVSDGTSGGTTIVKDIVSGAGSSNPAWLRVLRN
jgi:ELWxxDGT repeat protein